MTTIDLALKGYRLTTAEILYHLPDYPRFLQSFILQRHDLAPRYPELARFLAYWEEHIEAKIHSVKISSAGILTPAEFRHVSQMTTLH